MSEGRWLCPWGGYVYVYIVMGLTKFRAGTYISVLISIPNQHDGKCVLLYSIDGHDHEIPFLRRLEENQTKKDGIIKDVV